MAKITRAVKVTTCNYCDEPILKDHWRISDNVNVSPEKYYTLHWHASDPFQLPKAWSCWLLHLKDRAERSIAKRSKALDNIQEARSNRAHQLELTDWEKNQRRLILARVSSLHRNYEEGPNPIKWFHPLAPRELQQSDMKNAMRVQRYSLRMSEHLVSLRRFGGIPASRLSLAVRVGVELLPEEEERWRIEEDLAQK